MELWRYKMCQILGVSPDSQYIMEKNGLKMFEISGSYKVM